MGLGGGAIFNGGYAGRVRKNNTNSTKKTMYSRQACGDQPTSPITLSLPSQEFSQMENYGKLRRN